MNTASKTADELNAILAQQTREANSSVYDQAQKTVDVPENDPAAFDQETLAKAKTLYTDQNLSAAERLDRELEEAAAGIEEAETEIASDPAPTLSSFRRLAKTYAHTISLAFATFARYVYPRSLLTAADRENVAYAKQLTESFAKSEQTQRLNQLCADRPDVSEALLKLDRLEELIAEAPLTKEEKELLTDPLARVVEKYRWMQAGPEGELILALAIIVGKRAWPLMSK